MREGLAVFVLVAREDRDCRAGLAQPDRETAADAAVAAGNHGDAPFEVKYRWCSHRRYLRADVLVTPSSGRHLRYKSCNAVRLGALRPGLRRVSAYGKAAVDHQ